MAGDELVAFFNTFGGGGKPIGGVHENFGVGAKTSLLPWNHYGMVVISWVEGEPAMIWVQKDPQTGEYGLRVEEVEDEETGDLSLETVYAPYDDEDHGVDWSAVKPEWIDDSGTVIVLLGNSAADDTVSGDPARTEADIKGLSTYLNRRLWMMPDGTEVYVDELRTQERAQWPRSEDEAHGAEPLSGPDRRTNLRRIRGARFYIRYPSKTFKKGKLAASGLETMEDGTEIDWYLWKGDRPAVQSYAARGGYIGALYRNELYDVTAHHSTYRSFGISEMSIRTRLWLIARAPIGTRSYSGEARTRAARCRSTSGVTSSRRTCRTRLGKPSARSGPIRTRRSPTRSGASAWRNGSVLAGGSRSSGSGGAAGTPSTPTSREERPSGGRCASRGVAVLAAQERAAAEAP
jgi:hypothetical protein